jgi:hypothetical protein
LEGVFDWTSGWSLLDIGQNWRLLDRVIAPRNDPLTIVQRHERQLGVAG